MAVTPIIGPMGGLGLTPIMGAHGGEKKFTSAECLNALIERIDSDPQIVRNQINLIQSAHVEEMRSKFWPALLDSSEWDRVSTHRPTHDDAGEKLMGTDREVREYENNVWMDENKVMTGKVTTEFGEIIDIQVVARW